MRRRLLTLGAAGTAAFLLAATRLPGSPALLTLLTCGGALAIAALGAWDALGDPPRWAAVAATLLALAAFLVPPTAGAFLAGIHPAVPALALLAFLDLAHEPAQRRAPWVGAHTPRSRRLLAYAPMAFTAALLMALPWALQRLLPARLGALAELEGVTAPLAVLPLLLGPLLAAAWLREGLRARPPPLRPETGHAIPREPEDDAA